MNRLFSRLIPNFIQKETSPYRRYFYAWVSSSALIGAFLSGTRKLWMIGNESSEGLTYPLLETPIRGVYHTTRVAGHAGLGGFVAGFMALTAPISVPLYILLKEGERPSSPPSKK